MVSVLKALLAPSEVFTQNMVKTVYREILKVGKQGNVEAKHWYADWFNAYQAARIYNIPDIQEPLAAEDFLNALGEKLAPEWAIKQLEDFTEVEATGRTFKTLDDYGKVFSSLLERSRRLASRKLSITSFAAAISSPKAPSKVLFPRQAKR